MSRRVTRPAAIVVALGLIVIAVANIGAVAPANQYFERTWARTDKPVADGVLPRTWMWGPDANTVAMSEEYAESPDGERTVQYYDKSRMEITHPGADSNSVWYVTNGLLVVEMVTGQMQVGDDLFVGRGPAEVPVAGDADDTQGPTYKTFASLRSAPPLADGSTITQRIDRNGNMTNDPSLADYGVTAAHRVTVPGIDHQVAAPFWTFMNLTDTVYENSSFVTAPLFLSPFYATGYPITEAYFATVKVAGTDRLVLMQCFERRCLTWTPGNPEGFVTEAGNVGLHYYAWRYPVAATPTVSATSTVIQTATATATYTATATDTPTNTATYTATATETEPPVEYPDERVYVTDVEQHRVQVFDLQGTYLFSFGEAGGGEGQFFAPAGIAVDRANGWVYVADYGNHRVQKFDLDGNFLLEWGEEGTGISEFDYPIGITVDLGGWVYVADSDNHRIQRFNSNGAFADEWGQFGNGNGQFSSPQAIAVDGAANAFVADLNNYRIQKFSALDGEYLTQWGSVGSGLGQYDAPVDVAVDDFGSVYVTDWLNSRVVKTDAFGNFQLEWYGLIPDDGLSSPVGIDVDPFFNPGGYNIVYVVDQGNDRVIGFGSNTGASFIEFGEPGTGDGQFSSAHGIAVYRPFP